MFASVVQIKTSQLCVIMSLKVKSPQFDTEHRKYSLSWNDFFLPRLADIEDMLFQQKSITCHTARKTVQLLPQSFPGLVVSRFNYHDWPPRSCDLTPLDFFYWGFWTLCKLAHKTSSIENKTTRCMNDILQHLCKTVMEKKYDHKAEAAIYLPDVFFHL